MNMATWVTVQNVKICCMWNLYFTFAKTVEMTWNSSYCKNFGCRDFDQVIRYDHRCDSVGWSCRREREQEGKQTTVRGRPRAIPVQSPLKTKTYYFFYYEWPAMQAHLSWQRPDDKELPEFIHLKKEDKYRYLLHPQSLIYSFPCFHNYDTRWYSFHRKFVHRSATSNQRTSFRRDPLHLQHRAASSPASTPRLIAFMNIHHRLWFHTCSNRSRRLSLHNN